MAATEGRLRSDHGFVPSIEINGASGAPLISATTLDGPYGVLDRYRGERNGTGRRAAAFVDTYFELVR